MKNNTIHPHTKAAMTRVAPLVRQKVASMSPGDLFPVTNASVDFETSVPVIWRVLKQLEAENAVFIKRPESGHKTAYIAFANARAEIEKMDLDEDPREAEIRALKAELNRAENMIRSQRKLISSFGGKKSINVDAFEQLKKDAIKFFLDYEANV